MAAILISIGWSQCLIDSLPPYLCMTFPAILSCKSGLSHNVINTLHVGNQHKMGSSGVQSLLFEMHTCQFSTIQLQYLKSVFEQLQGQENADVQSFSSSSGEDMQAYFGASAMVPPIGKFSDASGYGGFIPGERYLASMLNKAIERDEADANQHTALLEPDQLAINNSHKACILLISYSSVN